MTATKKTADEELDDAADTDDQEDEASETEESEEVESATEDDDTVTEGVADEKKAAAPAVTTGAKKPLGVKEVKPFEWKLVGSSSGLVLTLFKAVEKEEVEAQLERVSREGFYTDLRILAAAEPIQQAKEAKAALQAAIAPADQTTSAPPARPRQAGKRASRRDKTAATTKAAGPRRGALPAPASGKTATARPSAETRSRSKAKKADSTSEPADGTGRKRATKKKAGKAVKKAAVKKRRTSSGAAETAKTSRSRAKKK